MAHHLIECSVGSGARTPEGRLRIRAVFLNPNRFFVTPAESGCKEIDDRLDRRRASFETAASRPPQDEEFS